MYYKEFRHKSYTKTQFFNNKFKIISTQLIQKDFASYEIILIFETHVLMGFSEKEKFEVMCFYENSLCWESVEIMCQRKRHQRLDTNRTMSNILM